MAGEWRDGTLGDFITLQRGFDLPARVRSPGRVPVVSSSGVSGYHSEAQAKGPGVVTGRYGTIGQVFYVEGDYWPLNTTLWVKDFKSNHPRFVYYFLHAIDFDSCSDKSGVPGVNRNDLHALPASIPSVPEQLEIARLLGTLDDKIELNRRLSGTLEGLARAVFRSWFVDFDPVVAKAAGRRPLGMTAATAALFPDSFADSPLGPIPKGWRVEPLGKHVEAVKGLSYKGQGLSDAGVPLHNLNSVLEGGGYKYTGIKWYTGESKDRHRIRPGDVIVANTEQGHDCLLIGYAAIVPNLFGDGGIYSHHLFRLDSRDGTPLTPDFVCHLLNTDTMHDAVSGYGNGTTVNMLPADALEKPEFVRPPDQLVQKYTELAQSARQQNESLVAESRTLAALRDALLPRLLSGELRLKDAGRVVGRAV